MNVYSLTLFLWLQLVSGIVGDVVDLGWPFDENTAFWPNTKPFTFTSKIGKHAEDGSWYAMNEYCAGEHGGTHFDAPYHFNENGWKVGDVPLEKLINKGICIDMTKKVNATGPNTLIDTEDIILWEKQNGKIETNTIVLIKFGWSLYYGTDGYFNINNGTLAFPGLSKKAAELFVERGVAGVGLDTPSIDTGKSTTFDAHKVLAKNNIFNLENLNIPSNFPATGYTLYVLPMKIREGTGAPLRIIAITNLDSIHPQT